MRELTDQILSYLKAIWRYRWYAVVIAWIIALGGWSYVYLMPNRYEAYTRVHVDTESVLRPLLTGIAVQPDLDQMVTMMSQTLISRPNLEKVIGMAGLDIGLKTEKDRAELIRRLSLELSVKSGGRQNMYGISFIDQDPQVAKRVVESLLKLFVEGSLSDKRNDSEAAKLFIDEQLDGYREKLVAAESKIMEFKRRNAGLLPGDGSNYFQRLVAAKDALSQVELELKEAENSRDSIKKQLATVSEMTSLIPSLQDDEKSGKAIKSETEIEIDARIAALEQKLDDLRLQYTEQHPDIVAIVHMIAQFRERKETEAKLFREQMEAEAKLRGPSPVNSQSEDLLYQQLTMALTSAEANVAAMKTRFTEYSKRYANIQASVNAVPQVEAEYTQLTRDYATDKARYDELLRRRESATISGDLEESHATMDFRVIDPPRVPSEPFGPNRPKLITMVLLAALACGSGTAVLLSQMRPTINDERRLREVSGLPVLGTVIMFCTYAQKKRRTWGLVAFSTSFASLLSAYVAIMAALVLTVSRA